MADSNDLRRGPADDVYKKGMVTGLVVGVIGGGILGAVIGAAMDDDRDDGINEVGTSGTNTGRNNRVLGTDPLDPSVPDTTTNSTIDSNRPLNNGIDTPRDTTPPAGTSPGGTTPPR